MLLQNVVKNCGTILPRSSALLTVMLPSQLLNLNLKQNTVASEEGCWTPFHILATWSDQWLWDARLANTNAAAQLLSPHHFWKIGRNGVEKINRKNLCFQTSCVLGTKWKHFLYSVPYHSIPFSSSTETKQKGGNLTPLWLPGWNTKI